MISPNNSFLAVCCVLAQATSLSAITLTVTNTDDSGPGSLRQAIADAVDGDTIEFDQSLDGGTITLDAVSDYLLISDLEVEIDASTLANGITIDGDDAVRILAITGASDVSIQGVNFTRGYVMNQNGGGLFLAGGNLELSDCSVTDCFATFNGGGINLGVGVTATIDRCHIAGNRTGNTGFGGGLFIGGASTTTISNTVVSGNSCQLGGGLMVANSSPNLVGCTIQGNSGGGLRIDDASPTLTNCIVWGNASTGSVAAQQLRNLNGASPNVSHCLVQGASSSASFNDGNAVNWGSGNLNGVSPNTSPAFAGALSAAVAPHLGGDLTILVGSSAFNAGNNSAVQGSLDLGNSDRIVDGAVDMGAHESHFVTFSGQHPTLDPSQDSNQNGVSNLEEYGYGIDPSGSGLPPVPNYSSSESGFLLSFTQRSNASDLDFIWETSTDQDLWIPMIENTHYTIESAINTSPDQQETTIRVITDTDPFRFYRQGFAPKS